MNYFEELNQINVNDKTEKKNGLTYLSWAWAWGELKKRYPKSFYTIYENKDGWFYFTDGNTGWVKTGVTVVTEEGEIEHIEYLPIMDYRNQSIPAAGIKSFDVNKAIQRSLTKAVARHGLGLYIYAGEDVPNEKDGTAEDRAEEVKNKAIVKDMASESEKKALLDVCKAMDVDIKGLLKQVGMKEGDKMTKEQYAKASIVLQEISESRK